MKLKILALMTFSPAAFICSAESNSDFFTPEKVRMEIGFGDLSGKTKERVYDGDDGHKNSQLNWKYNNAAIVKSALDWDVIPWISLGAAGWTTIASRGGYMVDTDWVNENQTGYTDRSRHPNTRLNYANEYDINVKGWLLNETDYRLGIMAGYQQSRYSFQATGGYYNYTDEDTGLPDIGAFPADLKVIGYNQHYRTPYVGLTGSYRYKDIEVGGAFKYSGWVKTTVSDVHYLRATVFRADTRHQKYYQLVGNIGYYLTPAVNVFLEGNWSRTTNKRGELLVTDYVDETIDDAQRSSGIENYSFMSTAGLKYSF